jgi:3-ketoacyl-CoA synthase
LFHLLLLRSTGEALKANITTLGPLVLPFSEQLLFAANMVARRLLGRKRVKPYVPDFTTAFDHICIHTGGRGVIDEIEKHLRLNAKIIEPSRAALFRWAGCCIEQGVVG